ncbi:phosphoribosyltransferase family protein [Fodinibius halophilus]|uniref:Phosphoribosyltransferase domain-containing protein n=1 Tax=Fodinibius halophilus TaxID=1736908 RepID=A0A6M1T2A1_9BACT|nr:phosphoribosyltransferase family protein [Fodinibius halophilus]NGP89596.1 hypothetical protein [Fodinibius halophilus]
MDTPLVLMDTQRINRSAKRMAYEILERNTEDNEIFLFGINERGYAVAQKLSRLLSDIAEVKVSSAQLLLEAESLAGSDDIDTSEVQDKLIVLVDDVIFSGHTMFQALNIIADEMQPSEIHTAVMIDRGHRKFPIQAQFCGMELPTKVNEHVSVIVEDMEVKEVTLEKV